ncbi:MAG: hypothetical protein JWQ87_5280 [Candidatus Sulfotelmatobacter sp.]|nr:hypothetical protein [Candidatus Sulfotelmatobacter sp.]
MTGFPFASLDPAATGRPSDALPVYTRLPNPIVVLSVVGVGVLAVAEQIAQPVIAVTVRLIRETGTMQAVPASYRAHITDVNFFMAAPPGVLIETLTRVFPIVFHMSMNGYQSSWSFPSLRSLKRMAY